jgi:hypothetical protein
VTLSNLAVLSRCLASSTAVLSARVRNRLLRADPDPARCCCPSGLQTSTWTDFLTTWFSPPGTKQSTLLLQAQQRVVDRPFVPPQSILARLHEPSRDAISTQRPERVEGLQNHQVQRALQYFRNVMHAPRVNVFQLPVPSAGCRRCAIATSCRDWPRIRNARPCVMNSSGTTSVGMT